MYSSWFWEFLIITCKVILRKLNGIPQYPPLLNINCHVSKAVDNHSVKFSIIMWSVLKNLSWNEWEEDSSLDNAHTFVKY